MRAVSSRYSVFLLFAFVVLGLAVLFYSRSQGPVDKTLSQPALAVAPPTRPALSTVPTPSPTATTQPTATPVPTATPIPAPVKYRDVPAPAVGAVSAAEIDELSGAVIFTKNAHAHRAPASITKIVTAIVALERGQLDDVVTVRYDPADLIDSTVMGVNPDDRITLRDLLYGLMLPSGNDAAIAIANHIAGSEEAFAALMNARMTDLGLTDSHFVNPHGLDDDAHYTSAFDMAMVSRYAMRNSTFREIASARLHAVTVQTASGTRKSYDVFNLNRLVGSYPGADGIKVGYTDNALRTIVGSAVRDGHRVYVALLGSQDLWTDTPALLDYAFKNFRWPDLR